MGALASVVSRDSRLDSAARVAPSRAQTSAGRPASSANATEIALVGSRRSLTSPDGVRWRFEAEPASCYHRIVTTSRGDPVLFGVNPPLTFKALASGSSGNAYLLRTDRTTILVEAGLRLPVLRKYLANEGLAP